MTARFRAHPDNSQFDLQAGFVLHIDGYGAHRVMWVNEMDITKLEFEIDVQQRTFPDALVYVKWDVEAVCTSCGSSHDDIGPGQCP